MTTQAPVTNGFSTQGQSKRQKDDKYLNFPL